MHIIAVFLLKITMPSKYLCCQWFQPFRRHPLFLIVQECVFLQWVSVWHRSQADCPSQSSSGPNPSSHTGTWPTYATDPGHRSTPAGTCSSANKTIIVCVSSYILYVIWQCPILRIAHSVLHFTPRQTCSIEHHFHFSGMRPAMLQLMHEDYSSTNIHHCL